jgi:hypothetical protein
MTENGKVTIVADDNGSVIRVSKNNPEFGCIRIVQDRTAIGSGNWVKKQSRSTLIHGTVEDLQATGLAEAKTLPGHIIVRESFEPFSNDNPDRDLKIAGDTGVVCVGVNTETGEVDVPIYRKSFYSMDMNEHDTLIAHTNGQAIREANGIESKKVTITKDQLNEMTNNEDDEEPKSTRRNKSDDKQVDIEDSIEEIQEEVKEATEEVEVEDDSFEL